MDDLAPPQIPRPKGAVVRENDGRHRRSRETHDRIIRVVLDAALAGQWRVPLAEVARRSGCCQRNVFQHFGSQEGLRNEVIRRHKQELIAALPGNLTKLLNTVMDATYADE